MLNLIILLLKKSARFCSLTSDVMLPIYRRQDCLDKLGLLPMPIPSVGQELGAGDLEY